MATSGGLWPHFLRITKIGDSQKARQRAWTHAMTHSNERACINTHDDSCGSCMTCPCACGMRHRQEIVSGARRVTRHVFLRRTSGLSELKYTCQQKQSPKGNVAGGKIRLIRGPAVRRIQKNVPLRVMVKTGTPALRRPTRLSESSSWVMRSRSAVSKTDCLGELGSRPLCPLSACCSLLLLFFFF